MQREKINDAPSTPGVYVFYENQLPIYIGKAINIKARLLSHFQSAKIDTKERLITSEATSIKYFKTDSDFRALLLEAKLINLYKPHYNVRGRDDKSNLYLQIDVKNTYPKLQPVRQSAIDKDAVFFGPFPSQAVVLEVMRYIRRIVPFCTQKKITSRPCFYSKIHLCSPCPNYIESLKDMKMRKKLIREYRKNIYQIIRVLSGKTKVVLNDLHKQLKRAIESEDYELGITVRNQILRFENLIHQKVFKYEESFSLGNAEELLVSLRMLMAKYFPKIDRITRIEGYDISNFQQSQIVGSLVVFISGIPSKENYRRFKIKKRFLSDFERLDEVITRRFKNSWPKPDLLVIDGGKPQVRAVLHSLSRLDEKIHVIGIAKGPDRLVIGTKDLASVRLPLNHPGFNLIRVVRDESHRFAKKYHLLLRSKNYKL